MGNLNSTITVKTSLKAKVKRRFLKHPRDTWNDIFIRILNQDAKFKKK